MATLSSNSPSNPSGGDSVASPVFPTEILSQIIHYVAVSRRPRYRNPDDPAAFDARWQARHPFFRLQNLRLVSRNFDKLAADYLFHRLIVSGYSHRSPQSDLWRALADGSTRLGSSVRRINIAFGSFSSAHSQRKRRELMQQEVELSEVVARAIPKLPLLAEAIVNLQVRCPEPVYRYTYRYTYQKPIVTARHLACINRVLVGLATLPRVPLKVLKINGSVSGFPPVVGFTELKGLTIRNPLDADMVSALITDNPHLDILTISAHFFLSVGDVLPSLLPDADRRLKVLDLEHLTFLPGDVPLLIPFIKELKSMAFFCMDIPDNLWLELTGLSTPSCFLRRLSIVDCQMPLTESFVDFISSCSVLESLQITSSEFDSEEFGHGPAAETVCRFWIDALPCLAGSLRELDLYGPQISGLCIQDVKYIDALSNCRLLKVMKVVVDADLAAQTRTIIKCILTTLCQNSWPVMRTLCMDKCPTVRGSEPPIPGHYMSPDDRGASKLLLHNTEFETSTEQICQTRISVFHEAHVFRRVDGVVRFLERRLETQEGHAGHTLWHTHDDVVDQGESDDDESDGAGYLPWYFEPGLEDDYYD